MGDYRRYASGPQGSDGSSRGAARPNLRPPPATWVPAFARLWPEGAVSWATLVGIAIGLAMDAFAVSIAAGLILPAVTGRHTFRMAFHFGLFQFLMPVAGWLAGRQVAHIVGALDHWLALGVLGYVGAKMLRDAAGEGRKRPRADPTRGWTLVGLAVATSLDALAVGFSMAFLNVVIWSAALVIGLVAGGLSAVGILFGARLGPRAGRWAQIVGGGLLILIGLHIVAQHLLGR